MMCRYTVQQKVKICNMYNLKQPVEQTHGFCAYEVLCPGKASSKITILRIVNLPPPGGVGSEGRALRKSFEEDTSRGRLYRPKRAACHFSQGGILPSGGGIPPSEGGILPPEGGMPPSEGGILPSEGGMPPSKSDNLPSGGGIPPSEGGVLPPEGGMPPSEGGILLSEGGMPPSNSDNLSSEGGITPIVGCIVC